MFARRIALWLMVGTLVCGALGCMSIEHLIDQEQKLRMYGGTTNSWDYMTDPDTSIWGSTVRLFDFPLTAVMDTVLLPVSAPVHLTRGGDS